MQKSQDKLRSRLPLLTFLLLVLQPCLDVLGFGQTDLQLPDALLPVLRFFCFLVFILAVVIVSRRKKRFILLAVVMLAYFAGHFWAISRPGVLNLLEDIKEQLRALMLLPLVLSFICAIEENPRVFLALKRGLLANLLLIGCVMLISTLTGTDPHTYSGKQTGVLGWFLWPNGQCAILCVLSVIALTAVCVRFPGKPLPLLCAGLICFGMLYSLGTRISFAAIPAIGAALFICLLLSDRRLFPSALSVLLIALLFTALYPLSPMAKSQELTAQNAAVKQERIAAAVAPYGVPADDPRALAAAYRYGLQGLVDLFGLETVREQYDDSLDQSEIFGSRKMKIVFNELLMQENGVPSRLFGLEVSRMRQQTQFYDFYLDDWIDMDEVYSVENDFHGLFFSGGLFLLILIGGTLLYIGLQALFVLIRDPKTVFRPEWVGFAGAFCFVLVTSVFTSALLRQTNGLVYVAAVLAGLRHLTLSRSADKAGR